MTEFMSCISSFASGVEDYCDQARTEQVWQKYLVQSCLVIRSSQITTMDTRKIKLTLQTKQG